MPAEILVDRSPALLITRRATTPTDTFTNCALENQRQVLQADMSNGLTDKDNMKSHLCPWPSDREVSNFFANDKTKKLFKIRRMKSSRPIFH